MLFEQNEALDKINFAQDAPELLYCSPTPKLKDIELRPRLLEAMRRRQGSRKDVFNGA